MSIEMIGPLQFGQRVKAIYKNHRGEIRERHFTPQSVWYGPHKCRPGIGWNLRVFDLEKGAERDYCLGGFMVYTPEGQKEAVDVETLGAR